MCTQQAIITYAQEVLAAEAAAIEQLIPRIDSAFVATVQQVIDTRGRVIVTGIGKPGYIARKLAATLMSTGTPASYLHPAEALHGDLGMITTGDIVIAISNSGETAEIINLLPTVRKIGVPVIAICGNHNSTLANFADYYLDAQVVQESCPLNLAPTTSTTAQLALADALAMAVMKLKQFSCADFAFYHPGGNLGQVRLLTVKKLVERTQKNPQLSIDKLIADALLVMTESAVGAACVVDEQQRLLGIITDGDIRRQLKHHDHTLLTQSVKELMTLNPTTIHEAQYASEALTLMQHHQPNPITVLPVINDQQRVTGMVHLTDLLACNR